MSHSQEKNHVLDISQYSIDDLFGLFDLPKNTREIRTEHMKIAKHKVMQSHPDKSHLPTEYFIFYKRAFERIVQIYESQHKTEQRVPVVSCKSEEIRYTPMSSNPCISSKRFHQIQQQRNQHLEEEKAKMREFNNTFNQLFEDNMWEKPDVSKNEWFQRDENPYADMKVQSVSQMNSTLEKIKEQEKQRALAVYRGVQPLMLSGAGRGANFYEESGEIEDNGVDNYISSDIFGKLKYDDLRKVHKDQTVFMVSDTDMANVKTYASVDQYKTARESNVIPMEKTEAERIFVQEEQRKKEIMMQREHLAHMKSMEYAEKNKKVMSSFLQLR
jgi:hypothetical protein